MENECAHIKIKSEWFYYYRAVDKFGDVVDYYLSSTNDEAVVKTFLNKALTQNVLPDTVVIDGSKSNHVTVVNELLHAVTD